MLCIRPDASVAQWPVRKQRRWRYAQCRELLLSCLTQLAEGSNLVQAVSVGLLAAVGILWRSLLS